jgi:iron complex transport system permease protein
MGELPAGVFTAAVGAPFLIWLARRAGQAGGRRPAPSAPARMGAAIHPGLLWGGTITLLVVVVTAGLAFGDQFNSLTALFGVVTGTSDGMTRDFVLNLRLPRVLVAGLVGAALAVSGLLIQGVVRNPLSAPDLVGVAPGAGVGAVAVLVAFPGAPIAMLPVAAFAGGVIAFALVYAVSWSGGVAPTRLALVGVGVSAAAASLTTIMVVQAEFSMTSALAWLSGSTYAKQWGDVVRLLPWVVVLLPAAWLTARWLDLLALGDDLPRGLGIPLERTRLAILGIAVGLAAAAVATAGTIAFVGLIAPHAARLLAPGRHRLLVPYAALLGAVLVITADTLGRALMPPNEIASGLITAMLGAPYFLWLLSRSRNAAGA